MRYAIATVIILAAAAAGWLVAGRETPKPADPSVGDPSALPQAAAPAEAPSTQQDQPARQAAYRDLAGRHASQVIELAAGDTAIDLPPFAAKGSFTYSLRHRREGNLVTGSMTGEYERSEGCLKLRAVKDESGTTLLAECTATLTGGILKVEGLDGLDKATTHRVTEVARQLRLLTAGFPGGALANGAERPLGGEAFVASVAAGTPALLVARREVGERNGRDIYPRQRAALNEVQVLQDAAGAVVGYARVFGSSATDGDDFELYRLELRFSTETSPQD